MQRKEPNEHANVSLIIIISSITLMLIGIISMIAPFRIVYADDDSSDQSQADQSSPS
jgi:hypothetical protein